MIVQFYTAIVSVEEAIATLCERGAKRLALRCATGSAWPRMVRRANCAHIGRGSAHGKLTNEITQLGYNRIVEMVFHIESNLSGCDSVTLRESYPQESGRSSWRVGGRGRWIRRSSPAPFAASCDYSLRFTH